MTLAFEIVLALALAGLSLLVYMMIRQVGVVTRRLPLQVTDDATVTETISPGEECPVVEFASASGQEKISLPLVAGAHSFLLFTSFSCSKCRAVMGQLASLPDHVQERLVVMILDVGFADYYSAEIEMMNLQRVRMVEAFDLATPFRVQGVPFLYTVDSDLRVVEGNQLLTPRDLLKHVRKAPANAPALGA